MASGHWPRSRPGSPSLPITWRSRPPTGGTTGPPDRYRRRPRSWRCVRISRCHARFGHMAYTVEPRVDDYINGLPAWQQKICQEVRELVHAADPEVEETIKRTRQPY